MQGELTHDGGGEGVLFYFTACVLELLAGRFLCALGIAILTIGKCVELAVGDRTQTWGGVGYARVDVGAGRRW